MQHNQMPVLRRPDIQLESHPQFQARRERGKRILCSTTQQSAVGDRDGISRLGVADDFCVCCQQAGENPTGQTSYQVRRCFFCLERDHLSNALSFSQALKSARIRDESICTGKARGSQASLWDAVCTVRARASACRWTRGSRRSALL